MFSVEMEASFIHYFPKCMFNCFEARVCNFDPINLKFFRIYEGYFEDQNLLFFSEWSEGFQCKVQG